MRSPSIIRATLLLALFGCVAVAQAAPVTYVQTGIASGMIGGSPFTDALVQLTVTGDTANVQPLDFDIGGGLIYTYYVNASSATTVQIPGLGIATVTDPTGIWAFPQPINLDDDPVTPDSPGVVIGTVDNPPALDSFTGLGGTLNFALLGYDLTTSIATVGGILSGAGYPVGLFVNTTLGNLSFASNISPNSVGGSFTATVADVPEPVTMLLFAGGMAAFTARRRLRARR